MRERKKEKKRIENRDPTKRIEPKIKKEKSEKREREREREKREEIDEMK